MIDERGEFRKGNPVVKNLTLIVVVSLMASLTVAADIPSEEFSAVAEKLVTAYNEVDPEGVKILIEESSFLRILEEYDIEPEAWPSVWAEQTRLYYERFGRIESHHVEELDPPDGAFLTLHHERGASELFMVLNEQGQATELNMRPVGQHSCSSGGTQE